MSRAALGAACLLPLLLAGCTASSPSEDGAADVTAPASEAPVGPPDEQSTAEPPADQTSPTMTATARASSPDSALDTAPTSASSTSAARVTIGGTGDLLAHESVIDSARVDTGESTAYDFSPMFAEVEGLLGEPDLSLCHLETPLSPDNTSLSTTGGFTFNAPYQLADAIADAGWDGCEFASNHTMDHGLVGLADTESLLREAGLGYTGPTAYEKRAGIPATYDVRGSQVAHLAYTYTYPNDGSPTTVVPPDAPWLERNLWPAVGADGIIEDSAKAREDGADFVVVSMHWGQEYTTEPSEQQRSMARDLLDSGDIDLILGTQVHVVQPCEKINGRYVFYGLGNFLSNQSPETTGGTLRTETQEGMVAQIALERGTDGALRSTATYQPTRVDLDGHVVRPVSPDSATYRRTVAAVQLLGPDACDARPRPRS